MSIAKITAAVTDKAIKCHIITQYNKEFSYRVAQGESLMAAMIKAEDTARERVASLN